MNNKPGILLYNIIEIINFTQMASRYKIYRKGEQPLDETEPTTFKTSKLDR